MKRAGTAATFPGRVASRLGLGVLLAVLALGAASSSMHLLEHHHGDEGWHVHTLAGDPHEAAAHDVESWHAGEHSREGSGSAGDDRRAPPRPATVVSLANGSSWILPSRFPAEACAPTAVAMPRVVGAAARPSGLPPPRAPDTGPPCSCVERLLLSSHALLI